MSTGDFGGGGVGLIGANLFQFLIGEAVEIDHDSDAAADCGVGGRAERPILHLGYAFG